MSSTFCSRTNNAVKHMKICNTDEQERKYYLSLSKFFSNIEELVLNYQINSLRENFERWVGAARQNRRFTIRFQTGRKHKIAVALPATPGDGRTKLRTHRPLPLATEGGSDGLRHR